MISTVYVSTTLSLSLKYCRRHQRAWVESLDQWVAFPERAMYGTGARSRKRRVTPVRRAFPGPSGLCGRRTPREHTIRTSPARTPIFF
jgi:hypothetical protein